MMISYRTILVSIILFFRIVSANDLQELSDNPAGADIFQNSFINPALFCDSVSSTFSVFGGTRSYFEGLGEHLKNSRFLIQYNFKPNLYAGLSWRKFSADIFSDYDLNFNIAYKLLSSDISFGIKFGLNGISYNEQNFINADDDLSPVNDPVFQDSKTGKSYDFGLGIHWRFTRHIDFGLSADHIFEPNLALGSEKQAKRFRIVSIGTTVRFKFDRLNWSPELHIHSNNQQIYFGVGNLFELPINSKVVDKFQFSTKYTVDNYSIGFGLNIPYLNISMFYENEMSINDLSKVSSGTQSLCFSLKMRKKTKLKNSFQLILGSSFNKNSDASEVINVGKKVETDEFLLFELTFDDTLLFKIGKFDDFASGNYKRKTELIIKCINKVSRAYDEILIVLVGSADRITFRPKSTGEFAGEKISVYKIPFNSYRTNQTVRNFSNYLVSNSNSISRNVLLKENLDEISVGETYNNEDLPNLRSKYIYNLLYEKLSTRKMRDRIVIFNGDVTYREEAGDRNSRIYILVKK